MRILQAIIIIIALQNIACSEHSATNADNQEADSTKALETAKSQERVYSDTAIQIEDQTRTANNTADGVNGDAIAGRRAYLSKGCIGCHGPQGKSPNPTMFPALAGQTSSYIKQALEDFRSQRRSNPMMSIMAANITDEDIANIATYISDAE